MLTLKNAQTLGRTEMKNLLGGQETTSARYICETSCIPDGICDDGSSCVVYFCGPHPIRDRGYRCEN
ncbi:hypothetical protein DBR43_08140 [Pedobacter sp. KBW06]|uniref:hypothetical protein n=1 Tax=Pedobacter sp. KBW06 TaxID=2153359 RepID=UPI000F5ABD28|nr:hypothetical protein [Pedobacter sp. KBW06]RQO75317.1 hypothetical protein DBR43_08140 [Pedobacter sp. KBW06]